MSEPPERARLRLAQAISARSCLATSLLHRDIDEVLVLQSQLLGRVIGRNPLAIDHEAHLRSLQAKAAAISVHQLPERRRLLDLELDLAPLLVLHLQLDVLGRFSGSGCVTHVASDQGAGNAGAAMLQRRAGRTW